MLRGRLWGRRKWMWVGDAVLLLLCIVILATARTSGGAVAVAVIFGLRALTVGFLTFVWFRYQRPRRPADDAAADRARPPA